MTTTQRCSWVNMNNPLYVAYHDTEWGKPVYDDQTLFELLCLESYQSGLSWETVLNKREAFRQVFHQYEITRVAAMTAEDLALALQNPAIIRHRKKLEATVANASGVKRLQTEFGSFSAYLWDFVKQGTVANTLAELELPQKQAIAKHLAKDLKKRGFQFLGPTTVYSFMQASGMVNDHEPDCFCQTVLNKY